MRLIPRDLALPDDAGFTPAGDIFQRKELGDGLTRLITKVEHPLVIALDSGWGTGKTTFIKMWTGELRKAEIPHLVFDAFEHDYIDDAFAAIAGAIFSFAEERAPNKAIVKKFGGAALRALKMMARSGLKLGIRLGSQGFLSWEGLETASEKIAEEAAASVDHHLGELITKQRSERETLKQFRLILQELAESLSEESDSPQPLIVIVDELDRCSPHFALEVLEKIKHLFSVPNVHFVLSVHMKQLENSVNAKYGLGDDTQTYLEKFIHFRVTFAEARSHERDGDLQRYTYHLCNEFGIGSANREWAEELRILLVHFLEHRSWNMRLLQRVIAHVALIFFSHGKRLESYRALVILLCYLKATDEPTYAKARQGILSITEANAALRLGEPFAQHSNHYRKLWQFYFDPDAPDELKQEYRTMGWHYSGPSTPSTIARLYVDPLVVGPS